MTQIVCKAGGRSGIDVSTKNDENSDDGDGIGGGMDTEKGDTTSAGGDDGGGGSLWQRRRREGNEVGRGADRRIGKQLRMDGNDGRGMGLAIGILSADDELNLPLKNNFAQLVYF